MAKSSLISDLLKSPSQIRAEEQEALRQKGLQRAALVRGSGGAGGSLFGGMFRDFAAQQAADVDLRTDQLKRGLMGGLGMDSSSTAERQAVQQQEQARLIQSADNLTRLKAVKKRLEDQNASPVLMAQINQRIEAERAAVSARADRKRQIAREDAADVRAQEELDIAREELEIKRQEAAGGSDGTAAITNWEYLEQITDPTQRAAFARVIGADPNIEFRDLGGKIVAIDPNNPEVTVAEFDKGIRPQDDPALKGEQTEATGEAKTKVDFQNTYTSSRAKIVGAESVATELKELIQENPIAANLVFGAASLMPAEGEEPSLAWKAAVLADSAVGEMAALLSRLNGANFLQGYQDLKGGGSITEVEGQEASVAQSIMQKFGNISPNVAVKELDRLLSVFNTTKTAMDAKAQAFGIRPAPQVIDPDTYDAMSEEEREKYNFVRGEVNE